MSPYLSPKKAIAPISSASALVVSNARTGVLASVSRLARRSISVDLLAVHRLVVGEVEAQPVGRDERAGLLDVLAEHLRAGRGAAGGWRCGCGGWRRAARRRSRPSPAGPAVIVPSVTRADVAAQVGQGERGVEHLGRAGLGGDRAGVADLAAALGVERRAVEEDLDRARASPAAARRTASTTARTGPRRRRRCSRRTSSCRTARRPRGRRRGWRRRRRCAGPPWPAPRCSAISGSKPATSTATSRSPAISWVSSSGKPYVSWSTNAVDPDSVRARRRRARPRGSSARCAASGGSAPPPCRARRR